MVFVLFATVKKKSTTHLFLICPFAKACWHGSPLAVHTSDLLGISVQQWLKGLIMSHSLDDKVFMEYMQNIFIILWTIWYHRNRVVHEEIQPNPLEVVLTAQNLYYRYKEAYSISYKNQTEAGPDQELNTPQRQDTGSC